MLRNGFLEFLSVVYNSFQRHALIIFIGCDVNGGVVLKRTDIVFTLPVSPSTLQIMKRITSRLCPQVLGGCSHLKLVSRP